MITIINTLNYFLWEYLLVYGLLFTGLYFTFRLKFIQLFHFKEFFRSAFPSSPRKKDSESRGITPFQALSVSLAARVGTGNVTGVALALYLGGPGAIFWMWVVAFFGIATAYAESTLGQLYKIRNAQGKFRGGPSFYIANGLKAPWAAALFAVCLILAYGLVFNAVQANSIAEASYFAFGIPKWITGLAIAVISAIVIIGGIKKIAQVAEYVVPFMAISYLLVALYAILTHWQEVPHAFGLIFSHAFGLSQVTGGFTGGLTAAMLNGVKRGLFANEAGIGSSPNIAAVADPDPHHPVTQGFVQALGASLDIFIVCTSSAILILLSGQLDYGSQVTGMELTQKAMETYFGSFGPTFVAIVIFFFAFTSIIGNYSYAENAMVYLKLGKRYQLNLLSFFLLMMVVWGSLQTVQDVFNAADVSMGFMTLINIVSILLLSGTVIKLTNDYLQQKKMGKKPEFDLAHYPELKGKIDEEAWRPVGKH